MIRQNRQSFDMAKYCNGREEQRTEVSTAGTVLTKQDHRLPFALFPSDLLYSGGCFALPRCGRSASTCFVHASSVSNCAIISLIIHTASWNSCPTSSRTESSVARSRTISASRSEI